jgi:hypothetical protein
MITAAFIILCVAVLVLASLSPSWPGYAALALALIALLLAVVPGFLR